MNTQKKLSINENLRTKLISTGVFSLFLASLFKPSEEQGMYDWLIKPSYVVLGSKLIFILSAAIVAISIAISITHNLKKLKINKKAATLNISLFSFVLFYQTISFFSDNGSSTSILKIVFSFLVCIFLSIIFSEQSAKRNTNLLLAPALAGASFIIINSLLYFIDKTSAISPFGRMYGTTDHPNFFGVICALTAILLFGTYSSKKLLCAEGFAQKVALQNKSLLFFLALSILGVLLSGSRTALLTLIIGATATHLLSRGSIKISLLMLTLAAAVFSLLASYNQIISGSDEIRSLSTENNRTTAWVGMLESFIESPITGVGLQNIGYSENSYLRVISGSGLIGGVLFCIFLCVATHSALKSKKHIEGRLYTGAILALLVGAILEGYLVDAFSFPSLAFQYMATACISCSTKRNSGTLYRDNKQIKSQS